VFEDEKPALMRMPTASFDGFHSVTASVSKTLLVRFDYNKYSVAARALGRPVEVHAYADLSSSAKATISSPSTTAALAASRPSIILGTMCRCWRRSPGR
jgi:hypothetical protein